MAGAVVTIGNFDGVHVGHAALVGRAREVARGKGARVVTMSFDPHPATVLRPGTEPARLTSWEDRERLLRGAGADEVVRLEPTRELLGMEPEEFVDDVVRRYSPVAVVEGPDFRFGKGRRGDLALLRELGARQGFSVEEVAAVEVALSDHTAAVASSTLVRWLVSHGRVTDAARVLGREYEVEGEVVRGDRRGREIGYPTANVRTECLVPGDGVYAGVGVLPDGPDVAAAISVGTKPTFGEHGRAMEAFLIFDPGPGRPGSPGGPIEGLPEYGWRLRLRFAAWVRDQVRFGSVGELLGQMGRDCERVREIVAADVGAHGLPPKAAAKPWHRGEEAACR
jgi:riboflavin kinase/FMN adenylyltransferase